MDGIYGITEDLSDDIVLREQNIEDQQSDINYENTVRVSKLTVRAFKTRSVAISKQIRQAMLMRAAVFATSYQSASTYVKAILEDCYNIQIDVDEGPLNAVKHIAALDIVHQYVKKTKLPTSVKRTYMYALAEELAKASAQAIQKSSQVSTQQNVRARIVATSGRKSQVPISKKTRG